MQHLSLTINFAFGSLVMNCQESLATQSPQPCSKLFTKSELLHSLPLNWPVSILANLANKSVCTMSLDSLKTQEREEQNIWLQLGCRSCQKV